ncbi:MAG: SDR family NAD(P)-dependent oxidoreductase [Magnetococcales bacterium]|nr:SDR family NAD(P)-dependent oxidoreductase [Magnetococcales bacterium]MBF0322347.1 SDR family NAD(P)-dependent oxidoreductase [Magnetococcales bacterium]
MLLDQQIALVTGAGSGIGQAVAMAYAEAGATVMLLGRSQKALEKTHDRILQQGNQAVIVPLDLEKELHRMADVVQNIHARFGRLDILVHAAAQLGVLTPLAAYEPPLWETVFRVNVTAPFFLTRELLPLLHRSAAASVINITSSVGHKGRAYWGAYAASKAALVNLTETWSEELAPTPIRINSVNPGATATTMRAQAFPGEDPTTLPTPAAIVPVFLYLASRHSAHLRGQHLEAREWLHWCPDMTSPQPIKAT